MAVITDDEIVGYRDNSGKIFCNGCNKVEATSKVEVTKQDNIITERMTEDDTYFFCDECGKKL